MLKMEKKIILLKSDLFYGYQRKKNVILYNEYKLLWNVLKINFHLCAVWFFHLVKNL